MVQITHRYEMRDNKPQCVLYIYTPLEYEFGEELTNLKANVSNTVFNIRKYIQDKISNNVSKDSLIMLILDGVILGSASLEQLLAKN